MFYPHAPTKIVPAVFDRGVRTPEFGTHNGQMVLALDLLEDGQTFTVFDPVAYIFGCDYEQMPVVTGQPAYVAGILQALYSQRLGIDLSVTVSDKSISI